MKTKLLSQKRLSQLLFTLGLFLMCVNMGWGQSLPSGTDVPTTGDYRSRIASGSFASAGTWQVRTADNTWATATTAPTAANTVYIQAGHTVTVTSVVDCYSLHINNLGILAVGSQIVNVHGKIRAYTGAAVGALNDGLVGSNYYIGTDAPPVAASLTRTNQENITIRFKGTTRSLTVAADGWTNTTAGPIISYGFELTAGETGTLAAGIRAQNMTFVSGNITTGSDNVILNNFTINSGAKFTCTRNGSTTGSIRGTSATVAANILDIKEGGTLEFKAAAPNIGFNTFTNNGTVIYSLAGAQAFMTTAGSPTFSANTDTYNNITISGGATMTAPATTKSIKGLLTVEDGCTLNTGGLVTLKSTAAKTATIAPIGTGVISGNVTVERFIPAGFRQYRLLSPATSGGTLNANWQEGQADGANGNPGFGTHLTGASPATNGFDTTINNAASIFTHTNSGAPASWTAVANTAGTLTAGNPYLVYVRGSRQISNIDVNAANDATTLRTTGTLLTGTQSVTGLNATADGFSLIGNPFQAQVDMSAVLGAATDLVTGFYYVLNPANGAYSAFDFGLNSGTSGNANKYLQPGQACFVKTAAAPSAAPTLSFLETNKSEAVAQTAVFRTKQVANMLRLSLYDTAKPVEAVDGLIVAFDGSETNAVNENDANKLTNFNESMATANSGKLLAIEKRAIPTEADEIPLNISKYRGTSYSLKVQGSGLTETPYLVDSFTGTTTEIPVDGTLDYAYTVDAGNAATTDASRFKLIYAKTLKTIDNAVTGFALYPNPSKLNSFSVVVPQSMSKASLTVSNLLGQQLYSQNDLQSGATVKVNLSNAKTSGVYLVSLTSEGKSTTTKWIVE